MPQESFHSLQEDWKLEIQDMFDELRAKEKVKGLSVQESVTLCVPFVFFVSIHTFTYPRFSYVVDLI